MSNLVKNTRKIFTDSSINTGGGGGGSYVPYTGATGNVDLGINTITANAFIKTGGISSEFLKADGSVDTNTYITSAVTSVSGTLNRITSTGGATPVIDISASYVGQTSITTLGTIATGVWNGTVVGTQYGGTGADNSTNTSGSFLISNGINGNFVASTLILPNSATAQQIVFASSTNNYGASANFTFTPTADQALLIKGNAGGGFYLGALNSTYGGFWSSNISPISTNYALLTNGSSTAINIIAGGTMQFNVSDVIRANMNANGRFFFGGSTSATALVDIGASTTAVASLRIRNGNAPTNPANGEIWYDGTDLKMRIGGVTKTFTLV